MESFSNTSCCQDHYTELLHFFVCVLGPIQIVGFRGFCCGSYSLVFTDHIHVFCVLLDGLLS